MVGKSSLQEMSTLAVIREISDSNLETRRDSTVTITEMSKENHTSCIVKIVLVSLLWKFFIGGGGGGTCDTCNVMYLSWQVKFPFLYQNIVITELLIHVPLKSAVHLMARPCHQRGLACKSRNEGTGRDEFE